MRGGGASERLLELAVAELDDRVALGADEMVVMTVAADAITNGVAEVCERLDHPGVREHSERAVNGRQTDPPSAPAQPVVELLGGDVVGLAQELVYDGDTLRCRAQAMRA